METPLQQLRLAASPYKAEGHTVWKLQQNVPCRGSDLHFLPFRVCEVDPSTENPEQVARMIADALNVHEVLRTTKTEAGQDAVKHWIKWACRMQAHETADDPNAALDEWRDIEARTAIMIGRFGLVAAIQDTCRRMAERLPNPCKIATDKTP